MRKQNHKNKRWTADDAAYIRQHYGRVSLENMAAQLGRRV